MHELIFTCLFYKDFMKMEYAIGSTRSKIRIFLQSRGSNSYLQPKFKLDQCYKLGLVNFMFYEDLIKLQAQ